MIMPDGSRSPIGYLNWTKTWITHEYEKPGSLWGVNRQNYVGIFIPEYAYFDNNEKIEIQKLLQELKEFKWYAFFQKKLTITLMLYQNIKEIIILSSIG